MLYKSCMLKKIRGGNSLKIKYSKILEGNYQTKRLKFENIIEGIVNYIQFDSSVDPSYVNNKIFSNLCIKNNSYFWFELFPKKDNYVMTIMFDDKHKVIQWYIDISKEVCIDTNVPFQKDLYLDIVITPDGKKYILDIDELNYAFSNDDITIEEYNFAFKTLKRVEKMYADDFKKLKELTKKIYDILLN